jgi:transcriptional regulator with GAF, ATPase, and Fis domain
MKGKDLHSLQNTLELGESSEVLDKEALLELYQNISQVRVKDDLLKNVFPGIKRLFDAQAIFLCLIDQERRTLNPIRRICDKSSVVPELENLLDHKIPSRRGFVETMMESDAARIFDLEAVLKEDSEAFAVGLMHACGFVASISKPLHFGTGQFGVLTLWSKKNAYGSLQVHLLNQIGDLLSVSVGTLLAEEVKEKRKIDNEILLEISNKIVSIRSKEDVSEVLSQSLKSRIGYDDAVVTVFNSEKSIYEVFSYHVSAGRRYHPEFEEAISRAYPVSDTDDSFAHVPRVLDVAEMVDRGVQAMDFIFKSGIVELAVVKLLDGESLRGLLVLMSEKKGVFTESSLALMQEISYQLSIAVSKLLVLEQLLRKEKENGILLAVGNQLASIRKKEELGPLLIRQLSDFSFYSDISIAKIDRENPMTFSSFLVNETSSRISNPEYPKMKKRHHIFPDGVFEKVLYSNVPVKFDLEALSMKASIPVYVKFLLESGVVEMIGTPLRDRNVSIGVLFCFTSARRPISDFQMRIFQGIGNLLGTAVANIMANERIEQQLEEIRQYKEQLEEEKSYLQQEIGNNMAFGDLVGTSAAMREVYGKLETVAKSDSSILIMGETGTGKELLARAIHNSSNRKRRLMVKINCASIPDNLIESELFGHEKGAFTGAHERRLGKFELAHQGTLFLDEVGELPTHLQPKLLRVLQEREFERVGGQHTIKTDVRIIAATNRNLEKAVMDGSFRNDLYYRLNVFPLTIPPLRERKEDIAPLANHFLRKYSQICGRHIDSISASAMKSLLSYPWPGNVRELEHLIERSVLLCRGSVLKEVILPKEMGVAAQGRSGIQILKTHEENERDYILLILERCGGKVFGKGGAADILGLNVSTLNSKMKKLGIKKINPFEQK